MSGPGFGVVAPELVAAADDIDDAVAAVACYHFPAGPVSPDVVGHAELAATLEGFCRALDRAVVALAGTAGGAAENLRGNASAYAAGDRDSAQRLSTTGRRRGGARHR